MRTVHDLTTEELEELRDSYFSQLTDNGEEELQSPQDIPMEDIIRHYEGVMFVEDDFFCNLKD